MTQKRIKMKKPTIFSYRKTINRLTVRKYTVPPTKAKTAMNIRCSPFPTDTPRRNSDTATAIQNTVSAIKVTAADPVLRRTTRKKSYKNPAAVPSNRDIAASES